jgi:hypothetical protein
MSGFLGECVCFNNFRTLPNILESTARLNEITDEVQKGASGTLEGSQEVIRESDALERITKRYVPVCVKWFRK